MARTVSTGGNAPGRRRGPLPAGGGPAAPATGGRTAAPATGGRTAAPATGGRTAALATGGRTVPQEWIDYNGHMMDAYYFVAFTEATEAFLDHVGLGAAYRAETGCGIYTVESHLCFLRSVRAGDRLVYSSQMLGCDAKRLHVFHRMTLGSGDADVATNELMFLHVNLAAERVTAIPPPQAATAAELAAEHAALPIPQAAGRMIAMPGPA
jgi:acyl-CoA thioester hydrolase